MTESCTTHTAIEMRGDGTRHVYHVDPKRVEMMRQYLDRMWDKALASFKVFAERKNQ